VIRATEDTIERFLISRIDFKSALEENAAIQKDIAMKRFIQIFVVTVMMSASCALVAQAQPAPGPGGPPARGRGGPGGFGGFGARGRGGPPAPVPPQVAQLRPTTQELTQINDELKRLVDSDNSSAKPLLVKYQSLLTIQPVRANTAISPTPRNAQRHDAFVEIAKKGDIDLLLDGDSITDLWGDGRDAAKKAVYDKYFGNYKPANFAISGDTTQGVLWGLQNGEGQGFQPKAIMLMIGTNNTGVNTAPEIAEGVGAVVLEMRKDFPNAKILLLAIFPRSNPGDPVRDKIADVNKIIARLDDQQHVFYMDIGAKFLQPDGGLSTDIMPDRLHPSAKGYEIWGEAVKDKLAELMK
jgi:lysophospholipase L1-like esterase